MICESKNYELIKKNDLVSNIFEIIVLKPNGMT